MQALLLSDGVGLLFPELAEDPVMKTLLTLNSNRPWELDWVMFPEVHEGTPGGSIAPVDKLASLTQDLEPFTLPVEKENVDTSRQPVVSVRATTAGLWCSRVLSSLHVKNYPSESLT
jgi:hypothetical protein